MNKKELIDMAERERDRWYTTNKDNESDYEQGRYRSMLVMLEGLEKLDEPEFTEKEFWGYMHEHYRFDKEKLFGQLEEYNYLEKRAVVDLPTIPKYVAEFISVIKPNFNIRTVYSVKNHRYEKAQKWAFDNEEEFITAWLTGDYIVEEEKLYRLVFPKLDRDYEYGFLDEDGYLDSTDSRYALDIRGGQFTKAEIEEKYPLYLAFAEPVKKEAK